MSLAESYDALTTARRALSNLNAAKVSDGAGGDFSKSLVGVCQQLADNRSTFKKERTAECRLPKGYADESSLLIRKAKWVYGSGRPGWY